LVGYEGLPSQVLRFGATPSWIVYKSNRVIPQNAGLDRLPSTPAVYGGKQNLAYYLPGLAADSKVLDEIEVLTIFQDIMDRAPPHRWGSLL
jgi:hypothetical protein